MLAVCQPSVPAYAAACVMSADRHPCRPKTLTMMGGPVDARFLSRVALTVLSEVGAVAAERPRLPRTPLPDHPRAALLAGLGLADGLREFGEVDESHRVDTRILGSPTGDQFAQLHSLRLGQHSI